MVTLFNFVRSCQTVFYRADPFYIPTSNVREFQFLHSLALIFCLFVCLVFMAILVVVQFYPLVGFLMPDNAEDVLLCLLTIHSSIFSGKMSVQIVCPFFNWVVCLFVVELLRVLYIFCILGPCPFCSVTPRPQCVSSFSCHLEGFSSL